MPPTASLNLFPNLKVWIKADACSISPSNPTTPALPYANIFSGDPISFINSGTSKSPNLGARSKIVGLKSSTNPWPCHGFLKTAATDTNNTGLYY